MGIEFTKEESANEEWRDIVGYEGLYQVSNLGRVCGLPITTKFGDRYKKHPYRILTPTISKRGYYTVGLNKNGKTKTMTLHRLIAKAFIPNPENKGYIDHIDTNRLNNDIRNLRWVTSKENANNPLTLEKNRQKCKQLWQEGKFDNRKNRYSCIKVGQYTKNGDLIKVWGSIIEAAKTLGIDSSSISSVCLGTNPNRRSAGGYKWKHIGEHYIREIEKATNKL